jgi:hypothetical protein
VHLLDDGNRHGVFGKLDSFVAAGQSSFEFVKSALLMPRRREFQYGSASALVPCPSLAEEIKGPRHG